MSTKTNARRVVTPLGRLSYANIFKPNAINEGDVPKYSCELIFDKDEDIAALRAAANLAAEEKFGIGKVPKKLRSPFRDGEDRDQPAYEGKIFIGARSKDRPGVIVGPNRDECIDESEVYSGCYCRISVTAFAYDFQGNKGVSFALNHVWKVKDGESFGSRIDAADEFESFAEASDGSGLL